MPLPIDRVRTHLAEAMVEALLARKTSGFARAGEASCRAQVDAALAALARDLEAGERRAVRAMIHELVEAGLRFTDLRAFIQTLRGLVHAELEAELDSEWRPLEDWFFEALTVCTMRFVARREDELQRHYVARELEHLESQLAELRGALDEKTRLLELVRQASTPIAVVAPGVLIAPLVGTFDSFRAELLTEKLLAEVARIGARAAILDVSGVPVFDTTTADLIIRLARAVRLLGSEVFLVGMSAASAMTITALGVDLRDIKTAGNLQKSLALALALRQRRPVRPGDSP